MLEVARSSGAVCVFCLGSEVHGGCSKPQLLRRPTVEPSFVKTSHDFEASSLIALVFEGTLRSIRPNFDLRDITLNSTQFSPSS